MLNQNSAKEIV